MLSLCTMSLLLSKSSSLCVFIANQKKGSMLAVTLSSSVSVLVVSTAC